MNFKEKIKEARLKSGLSQEKAGKAIHRTRNAIKGYEEGISSPNPDQLVILCKLFNTTPNDLLGFQQQNEEAKMKHTKLPWHTGVGCPESVHAEDSSCVCDCDCGEPNKTILANAAFIVKAVNNHEKLIKALRDVAGFLLCDGQDVEAKFNPCKDEISQQINMIRKAIKQAEES